MTIPERLLHLDQARATYGARADRLAKFYLRSDRLADEALAATDDCEALVQRHFSGDERMLESAPPAVARLIEALEHVPFWVDLERCARGGAAFLRTGVLGGVTLGFGALAASYCSAGGNKPLTFTGKLIHRAYPRLAETGRFVYTVSQPAALSPGGPGFRAIIGVRLMHARVRRAALRNPAWRTDAWGIPINQADMAVTVLLFSRVLATFVRQLGGHLSEEEEADLIHLWRYAGYLLGVDPELLCSSPAEARDLVGLCELIDQGPDEDSRRLLGAMFDPEVFQAQLPNPRAAQEMRLFYQAVCRYLLGDDRADALELPRSRYDWVVRTARPLLRVLSRTASALPLFAHVQLAAGNDYWRRFIQGGSAVGASTAARPQRSRPTTPLERGAETPTADAC